MIQYPIVNEDNKPKFLDKILWFGRPTYEAVIVHVGYQNGRYKWNGLIHEVLIILYNIIYLDLTNLVGF